MKGMLNRKVVVAGVAVLAVAVTGGAIAATKADDRKAESQAVVNDAAKQLGVQPNELSAALKTALAKRVDAAVKAGTITKAEGDAMKARINTGDFPLFGGGHRGDHKGGLRIHHSLDAAASYLGLTEAQLKAQVSSGKTLAQVAKAQSKSVDGLVDALVKDANAKIDQAVKDGKLTKDQADEIKQDQREHLTDFVNNGKLGFKHRDGNREGRFSHPEPGLQGGPASLPAPSI
jgi:polyhydroxyalkanoate synthesis regulator phasin